jgi:hypothetical protein
VVWLHRQRPKIPPALKALRLDQLTTPCRHLAHKHRLAALGAPDQVVHDEVNAVLVSLVVHDNRSACSDKEINRYRTASGKG